MNELLDVCFFYWVRTTFLMKKMLDFDVFNECVTNQQTDQSTDRPTDTAYYRDARTHLKKNDNRKSN